MTIKQRSNLVILLFTLLGITMISACHDTPSPPKITTIGIQPYENFSPALMDTIERSLKEVYGFDLVRLPTQALPKWAFTTLRSPRYRADSLLKHLKRNRPDSINYMLGLTKKDISTTKRNQDGSIKAPVNRYIDWGIFGLGYRPGPSCVVSIYRLKNKNKTRYYNRIKKICMHEIGHCLGLPHCDNHPKCVMRDAAETIKTIDKVDLWLCDACKRQIE